MVRPLALTTLPPPGAGRTPVARARKAVDEFEAAGGVEELNLRLLASTTRRPAQPPGNIFRYFFSVG